MGFQTSIRFEEGISQALSRNRHLLFCMNLKFGGITLTFFENTFKVTQTQLLVPLYLVWNYTVTQSVWYRQI